jgi:hypothetical protein
MNITSSHGILIRLPDERWAHIIDEHPELAALRESVLESVGKPQRVLKGNQGELAAVREIEVGKWLVVVYRETGEDGFIITAFLTRRTRWLAGREQIWP